MLQSVTNWLDRRTGYRRLLSPIRSRILPNGPSWWYTTASCLLWLLVVEIATGLLLMVTYTPSTASAWGSVHYIEQQWAGTFLRGVHYYGAQAMIVLFGIHVARVLLAAAFRAPRELVWVTGLLLIPLVLVWSITGNPLSGTQTGMAQIDVEGQIVGSTPMVGKLLKRVLLGGDQVGQLTLTRLYFLHVGLLPLLVAGLLVIHITQIYRHGLSQTGTTGRKPARTYWPHQTARNMLALGLVLGTVGFLAWKYGAPLDVPADLDLPHNPRPEWYFRWLFELRRYFTGDTEFIATEVIPGAILVFLLAIPLVDHVLSKRASFVTRLLIVIIGCGGWTALTFRSLVRDWLDDQYQAAEAQSTELAARARALADKNGIPPQGAAALLQNDPKTQGPILFSRHCASCHSHIDANGKGIESEEPSAPNLFGFATRRWLVGFLDPDQIA
ncbi:MAG: cytochrome b N-terminal domain-containing protein, partial [Planctomycetales bacterium]